MTPFSAERTAIDDLWVITVKSIDDPRGTVRELYRAGAYAEELGLPSAPPWRQVNLTQTLPGAVRGLHGESMTKLVTVAAGEAFGAWLDARPSSPTVGQVVTADLHPGVQVLVPPGVCNGFQAVGTSPTEYLYCFDAEWVPDMAGVAVHPLDPSLGIAWPVPVDPTDPSQLSAKDAAQPSWDEVRASV